MIDEVMRQSLLDIFHQGRQNMTNAVLAHNPNLYKALYGRDGQQLFKLRLERYELYWLEHHWISLLDRIEQMGLSGSRKKQAVSTCARYYKEFLTCLEYPEFEITLLEQKRKILDILIAAGESWERDLGDMHVCFMQKKAALQLKIQNLERNN